MEEMSAWSGIDQANGEAVCAEEKTSHAVTVLSLTMGRLSSPVRRGMRRVSGDGMLGFIIYAVLFAGLFNSSTNSMQFGKMILVAIHADKFSQEANHELNRDLIRFIAVIALSVICLVQFFSPIAGRRLNNLAAVVKILFVLLLIIFGVVAIAASESQNYFTDWTEENCVFRNSNYSVFSNDASCCFNGTIDIRRDGPCGVPTENDTGPDADNILEKEISGGDPWVWAKALLLVLFNFQGWENATFVSEGLAVWRAISSEP